MKRFVVVGLGNFGSAAADALFRKGHEVVVVDHSEIAVDRIAPLVTRAAVGDGRSVDVLERLGARNADAAIVSTGDDIAASILATMSLKDMGVSDLYVKVISRDHARVMERIGVTETIFPERETALALAERVTGKALLNFVAMGKDFSIQEMAVPDNWNGQTLRALDVRRVHGVLIVAVHDVLLDQFKLPDPDDVLKESDTLIVAGKNTELEAVAGIK
jgi:trk system potassium uptake protein TrkA